jgi:cystathionine beta-lyase/cystathionine gamma-synthase
VTAPGERPPQRPETTALTAGRSANGPSLATPLWATSTFEPENVAASLELATTPRASGFYSRHGNPTVRAFEEAVAELEGAEGAQAFASGMGAISATVLAICSTGSHVVAARQLYSATGTFLTAVCPRFGIDVTFVDGTDPDAVAAAVEPGRTVLLYVETPANPLLELVDLEAVGGIVGPIKVVDSTFGGPLVQRPLEHGLDLVIHSATKSLAGHNDATLGVVAGSEELLRWIWGYATLHGAVASPFDALNGLRGIRTLGVRVRQHCETAQRLAEALEDHPAVERVFYPGLESHPQRELAKRQMAMGGQVLSVEVAGGWEGATRFAEGMRLGHLATSLGGPETLLSHAASSFAAAVPPDERRALGIGDGLVRVSVGLEHPDDLLADVLAALDGVAGG